MNDYKTIADKPIPTYQMQTIGPVATLRDQFAMKALFGVNTKEFDPKEIASKAFAIADAMMEARK
jgi:hypothetical protein